MVKHIYKKNRGNYNKKKKPFNPELQFQRLRLPMNDEILGRVIKLLGATKFSVNCADGNERICGVPGRFKRRFLIRLNDVVIIKPWIVQTNERGDIIYKYSFFEVNKLRETKNLSI